MKQPTNWLLWCLQGGGGGTRLGLGIGGSGCGGSHGCHLCPYRTFQKRILHHHLVAQHGLAAYKVKCPICSRAFNRSDSMQRHFRQAHRDAMVVAEEERGAMTNDTITNTIDNTSWLVHWISESSLHILHHDMNKRHSPRLSPAQYTQTVQNRGLKHHSFIDMSSDESCWRLKHWDQLRHIEKIHETLTKAVNWRIE